MMRQKREAAQQCRETILGLDYPYTGRSEIRYLSWVSGACRGQGALVLDQAWCYCVEDMVGYVTLGGVISMYHNSSYYIYF